MLTLTIPGHPVAFARAGSRGKRRFTPKPQSDYGNLIKLEADRVMRASKVALLDGPVSVTVEAFYVVPRSWTKKAKAAALWKTSKPDVDNIIKLVTDALTGIVYRDDAQVATVRGSKLYGERETLVITVGPLSSREAA